jgi:nucleoid DNA-binding protein
MKFLVNKRDLWRLVNLKINRAVHHYHVFSVMSSLFKEMLVDLKSGKEVKIHNFGKFRLVKNKPRFFINLYTKEKCYSEGKSYLKFVPNKSLKREIIKNLDCEKTFNKV